MVTMPLCLAPITAQGTKSTEYLTHAENYTMGFTSVICPVLAETQKVGIFMTILF